MKRRILGGAMLTMALLLVGIVGATAQEAETINLSEDRGFGLGVQIDYPFGGLISARHWLETSFGFEGIVFFWGYEGDLDGAFTARTLYRIADAPIVDFYVAAGASLPFSTYGYTGPIILSVAGGMEFGFRFAPSLAWNIEFGVSVAGDGTLDMLFGTGIHFYFLDAATQDRED